ncbi:putative glycolipid-binding domain-containing protein [Telluria beijingensis]|uniref:putative glycolipid-binding domain-containing protein n=1 Tax=Telluria beijingensis TaxID=3068633 RepID=UPI002795EA1C|nr:putative glycolipid-binding domain-containing protein [Massilia sp. REN29]
MERSFRWRTIEGDGLEYFSIHAIERGFVAEGVVIGARSGNLAAVAPFGCSYLVRCDEDWHVRQVEVRVAGGAHLLLRADGKGMWSGPGGAPLPALSGCIDVDLACTPFTNTLPIRRLGDALRVRHEIRVAYVTVPEAGVMPSHQAYTALGAGRYRFESLPDAFEADIATDADGLVVDYPGLFRRAPA